MNGKRGKITRVLAPFFVLLLLLSVSHVAYIIWNNHGEINLGKRASGFAVIEDVQQLKDEYIATLTSKSRLIIIAEWGIVFLTAIFLLIKMMHDKYRTTRNLETEKRLVSKIKQNAKSKSRTDLDTLYSLLVEKKSIPIESISLIFEVDKETAMDWCRILEESGLASIHYPAFGDETLMLENREEKHEEEE